MAPAHHEDYGKRPGEVRTAIYLSQGERDTQSLVPMVLQTGPSDCLADEAEKICIALQGCQGLPVSNVLSKSMDFKTQ